ncbi:hypothetical protein CWI36_0455p0010 [Hamiltosporidium magnivora]|uniref:Uncharacterized protein n=1 Tax=Hamiltosporidium magnivora TaxID=148818 RepID=A0A4Q9LG39_9MICR|nr:hypothetical protein CWI36_0455p0010 [Hamiltosporidium magnivora]
MKLGVDSTRYEEMTNVACFYYEKIKIYTEPNLHSFLLYFTTLICSIVYADEKFYISTKYDRLIINIDEYFITEVTTTEEYLKKEIYKYLNLKLNKKAIECVSNSVLKKIIRNEDWVIKIYEFDINQIHSDIKPIDSDISIKFVKLFIEETNLRYINGLNVFLKELTKKEYHKYISAVLIFNEILFLSDVLKTECEKKEVNEDLKKYRMSFINLIKTYLNQDYIDTDKNIAFYTLNGRVLPQTSALSEIYVLYVFFTNADYKNHLNQLILENLNNKQNNFEENLSYKLDETEKMFVLFVFHKESSTLNLAEKKIYLYLLYQKNQKPRKRIILKILEV